MTSAGGRAAIQDLKGDILGSARRVRLKILKGIVAPQRIGGNSRGSPGERAAFSSIKTHTWELPLSRLVYYVCAITRWEIKGRKRMEIIFSD